MMEMIFERLKISGIQDKNEVLHEVQNKNEAKEEGDVFVERI